MKSFMEELTYRLAAADPKKFTNAPKAEIKKEETKLGTADDKVKKLFIVWQELEEEYASFVANAFLVLKSRNAPENISQELDDIHELRDMVKRILLSEVRAQFSESRKGDYVSFTKDWGVVTGKKEQELDILILDILGPDLYSSLGDLFLRGRNKRRSIFD